MTIAEKTITATEDGGDSRLAIGAQRDRAGFIHRDDRYDYGTSF